MKLGFKNCKTHRALLPRGSYFSDGVPGDSVAQHATSESRNELA
jgi:hypothetical protein